MRIDEAMEKLAEIRSLVGNVEFCVLIQVDDDSMFEFDIDLKILREKDPVSKRKSLVCSVVFKEDDLSKLHLVATHLRPKLKVVK